MGRKKKYNTPEEKQAAQKKWCKEYYERNKEELDKRAKDRYHASKKSNNL